MKATTMFAIVAVAVCAVAGFGVWWTHSASPLWLVALLFTVKIKPDDNGGHP